MIFRELHLERYGLYETLSLLFPSPGLNVVFGPNEAGKSTCLSAIQDFLFGIRNNSPYGGRYGYDQMKIKATVRLADGQERTLSRRKGRGKTLSDTSGQGIDDSVLNGILGSLTRERFASVFGLDHEGLRLGGEKLFESEGDIGRLILEAGGGLRTLMEKLKQLEEEASGLFTPRRGENRKFYKLSDEFNSAKEEIRRNVLTVDDYRRVQENLERVQKKYQQLMETRKKLEVRFSATERAKRVLPLLRQMERIQGEIASYADVSLLRPDLTREIPQFLEERENARKTYEESLSSHAQMTRLIENLRIDTKLLEAEGTIRDLLVKATHVEKERSSRPTREREIDDQQQKLVRLREYLNLDRSANLQEHLPPVEIRGKAWNLLKTGRSIEERGARIREQLEEIGVEVRLEKDKKADLEKKGFHQPFDVDLSSLKLLPRALESIREQSLKLSAIEEEMASHRKRLGCPDSEALQAFVCPDIDMIEEESTARTELENKIAAHGETLRQAEAKSRKARKAIERLKAAGEVPTEEAIRTVRSIRNERWQPIRSLYLSPDPSRWQERPQEERLDNVERFEKGMEEADRLGDRKSEEAQRIAELGAMERERDEADETIVRTGKLLQETQKELDLRIGRFGEVWGQATEKESDLGRLRLFSRERGTLLEKLDKSRLLREEVEQSRHNADLMLLQMEQIETELGIRHEPGSTETPGIDQRIRHLERLARAFREGHLEWKANEGRLDQLNRQHEKGKNDWNLLEEERMGWEQEWIGLQKRLGFPPETTAESMESFLNEWSDSGSAIALTESLQHRLDQFDYDEKELAGLIGTMIDYVNFDLPEDPVAAAKMLNERLEETKNLALKKSILDEQLGEAVRDLETKSRKRDGLDHTIHLLCEEARVPEDGLKQLADRLGELLQKRAQNLQVLDQIQAASDGKTTEELREECKGRDPDAINGELSQIETEKQRMDDEAQNAFAEVRDLTRELERFSGTDGINAVERRRQNAMSDLKSATLRYLEVGLAHKLLQSAMNRLREEHQNPLIARAEKLFTLATGQHYAGIGTDIDEGGNPVVVGKKTTGETIHVKLMSDGTRDQLFLAFRIASIEQYCAHTEPLPFIADDLLVNFDDDRSLATLKMLIELGNRTQVLLFTHHQSVREMALQLAGKGNVAIHDLLHL
ncbi:MAG: AAA family ATPase [Leptospirales bacterium]